MLFWVIVLQNSSELVANDDVEPSKCTFMKTRTHLKKQFSEMILIHIEVVPVVQNRKVGKS